MNIHFTYYFTFCNCINWIFFSKISNGFSFVNLWEMATRLSLSISVITQLISSPNLNNFFADKFFVQLSSLEWSNVVRPGSNSQKAPSPLSLQLLPCKFCLVHNFLYVQRGQVIIVLLNNQPVVYLYQHLLLLSHVSHQY